MVADLVGVGGGWCYWVRVGITSTRVLLVGVVIVYMIGLVLVL